MFQVMDRNEIGEVGSEEKIATGNQRKLENIQCLRALGYQSNYTG